MHTSKQKHYYMLVGQNGNPIIIGHYLPIYWLLKIAKEQQGKYAGSNIVKCKIIN